MASITIAERAKLKQFFFPPASGCSPMMMWIFWISLHLVALFLTGGLLLLVTIPLQVYFHRKQKNKPKADAIAGTDVDHIFEEECSLLKKRSLERLGIDASQVLATPVEFVAPRLIKRILVVPEDTQGVNPDDVELTIGDKEEKLPPDGYCAVQKQEAISDHMRYSLVDYCILYPTTGFIACYSCAYSRINGQIFAEKTQEIYYSDVTQVLVGEEHRDEGKSNKYLVGSGKDDKSITSQTQTTFKVEISSGSYIRVVLDDPELRKQFGSFGIPDDYAQSACMALRKLVREKKGQ
jgi:hypothetical protein